MDRDRPCFCDRGGYHARGDPVEVEREDRLVRLRLAAGAFVALTRENLDGRVAAPPYLDELEPLVAAAERAYVCGSAGFASYATRLLGEAGVRNDAIRVEQFGQTG